MSLIGIVRTDMGAVAQFGLAQKTISWLLLFWQLLQFARVFKILFNIVEADGLQMRRIVWFGISSAFCLRRKGAQVAEHPMCLGLLCFRGVCDYILIKVWQLKYSWSVPIWTTELFRVAWICFLYCDANIRVIIVALDIYIWSHWPHMIDLH